VRRHKGLKTNDVANSLQQQAFLDAELDFQFLLALLQVSNLTGKEGELALKVLHNGVPGGADSFVGFSLSGPKTDLAVR
jgi:hypothetical protein